VPLNVETGRHGVIGQIAISGPPGRAAQRPHAPVRRFECGKRHARRVTATTNLKWCPVTAAKEVGQGVSAEEHVLPPDSGIMSLIQPPAANHLSQFNYLR
jgi:hypothetical protein